MLPTEVSLVVNCRILDGDTVESVKWRLEKIVDGRAEVRVLRGREPSLISRTDSAGYHCMKEIVEERHSGVLVVPTITIGGTDARNYCPICDNVYRFSGFPSDGVPNNIHTSNENMPLKACGMGPDFFARLLMKCGSYEL